MTIDTSWDINDYYNKFEPKEHWQLKQEFFLAHKNTIPEGKLASLAQVYVNTELLGCRYPPSVSKEVQELSRGLGANYRESRQNKLQRTFVKASDAVLAKIRKEPPATSKRRKVSTTANGDATHINTQCTASHFISDESNQVCGERKVHVTTSDLKPLPIVNSKKLKIKKKLHATNILAGHTEETHTNNILEGQKELSNGLEKVNTCLSEQKNILGEAAKKGKKKTVHATNNILVEQEELSNGLENLNTCLSEQKNILGKAAKKGKKKTVHATNNILEEQEELSNGLEKVKKKKKVVTTSTSEELEDLNKGLEKVKKKKKKVVSTISSEEQEGLSNGLEKVKKKKRKVVSNSTSEEPEDLSKGFEKVKKKKKKVIVEMGVC